MKPSGKGGAALTADRRVPDPDLCGPHCFRMPGQGEQTGKDWPCHTLSLPQFQVVGGTLYRLPGQGSCAHLSVSKAGSSVPPARLEKWGEGDVCAEGRQARPGGSNEACEGHRGCLGVRVMGGHARWAWRGCGSRGHQPFAGGCWDEQARSVSSGCSNSKPLITSPRLPRVPASLTPLPPFLYPSHLCNSWAPRQPVLSRPSTICSPWGVGSVEGVPGCLCPWKGRVELRFSWPGVGASEPHSVPHKWARGPGWGLRRLGSVCGP